MAKPKRRRAEPLVESAELKIIGGTFRGRKLRHEPFRADDDSLVTRPMKHRLRETIFNLVGPEVAGRHAIDIFAGTGALGLESLSRRAAHATFIERHVPTARVIEENIAALEVQSQSTLLVTSAFLWGKRDLAKGENDKPRPEQRSSAFPLPPSSIPWVLFCSPPYDFFVDRQPEMLELLASIMQAAPPASIVVVEADERFDFSLLGADAENENGPWDIRPYAPAVVGVWRKPALE